MRILMLAPHYEPDLGPAAPLFTMLATELVKRGHQVSVITSVPHYPSGRVSPGFRGCRVRRSTESGVSVIRIPIPSVKRSSMCCRMFQFACYQLGATVAGARGPFDVAFVSNPALWVWLPFSYLVARRRTPSVYYVFDLFPHVGVALGVFRTGWIADAVGSLERYCLDRSAVVGILSDSFRPGLCELGVPEEKMELIDIWVDTGLVRPLERRNRFALEQGLADSFVVLYAGNLGLSQGIEDVLSAAELLETERDIRFVFVGDGTGREALVNEARRLRLSNVTFLPFQVRERLPEVLAAASVSLVVLKKNIATDGLPSKMFSIMASGRPVLASVDRDSCAWNFVERAQAGLCVPAEDPSGIAEAILRLRDDAALCENLGRNGRDWVEKRHSPQVAAELYEKLAVRAMALKADER
jgi:colanic acid biosynthesis glycosyl transferase WcaI